MSEVYKARDTRLDRIVAIETGHEKPEAIRALCNEMASTYGYIDLVSSFGFTVWWRHGVVQGLPLSNAASVIDLLSGMGALGPPHYLNRSATRCRSAADMPECLRMSDRDSSNRR
jgi:hypothetical protein